jgi:hypothetical protein
MTERCALENAVSRLQADLRALQLDVAALQGERDGRAAADWVVFRVGLFAAALVGLLIVVQHYWPPH